MKSIINYNSVSIKKALADSVNLTKKALALYYEKEENISNATNDILELNAKAEIQYIEIIELQAQIIDNLELSYKQIKHVFDVEKQKHNRDFNRN